MAKRLTYTPVLCCENCGRWTARTFLGSQRNYNYKQRFCAKGCASIYRHRNSKGFLDKNGYRVVTVAGRQDFEHRAVMAKLIGRPLRSDETVHHKNDKRADNDPSNLELWCGRHGRGQRVEDQVAFAVEILSDYAEYLTEEQKEILEPLVSGRELPEHREEIVGHASSLILEEGEVFTSPLHGV